MSKHQLLSLSVFLLVLLAIFSTVSPASSTEHQSQCRSLCATCQSLKPTRINQICSAGLLTGCSCPENALNLTSVTGSDDTRNNCPHLEKDAVGYCPHGQQTDPAGCPLGICRPPASCATAAPASPSRGLSGCRLFCPNGYQTDSTGCPLCRCRCQSRDEARGRCSESCSAIGLSKFELVDSGECPVCVCQQEPITTTPPPPPHPLCLLHCPNSCGPYGYADGESRDDRGCIRDCSCRCPARGNQVCPGSQSCLRWELDRFDCQVCSACSSQQIKKQPASSPCITRSSLQLPNAMDRLCPADCPGQQFSISEDSNSGCLTCTCNHSPANNSPGTRRCPQSEPTCSNSCGSHGHLRDSQGCLLPGCACNCPDLNVCVAGCSHQAGNVTVARDAYGCHACHCSASSAPSCPSEPRCSSGCGHHGFETDLESGCQTGCQCRCPKRSCGCFYGSRQNAYGCDTCECVTASEYLRLRLPF